VSNIYGTLFRISTFGESHGPAIGVIIDGCPAGLTIDESFIQAELDRRKPGQSKITTQRKESDKFRILSGVFEGKSQGTPIAIVIDNEDQRSKDYGHLENTFRPSHADYTYEAKYGTRDHRGGGRSSARETANWVAAGAIAKLILRQQNIDIKAGVTAVGELQLMTPIEEYNWNEAEKNIVRCPDPTMAGKMEALIQKVKSEGDTVGGM